jgi:hypothetical protein
MMDIVTNDNKGRQGAVETELRDWQFQDGRWREPWTPIPERKTATARWGRAVLIIAALSTLSWMVLILLLIAAISGL